MENLKGRAFSRRDFLRYVVNASELAIVGNFVGALTSSDAAPAGSVVDLMAGNRLYSPEFPPAVGSKPFEASQLLVNVDTDIKIANGTAYMWVHTGYAAWGAQGAAKDIKTIRDTQASELYGIPLSDPRVSTYLALNDHRLRARFNRYYGDYDQYLRNVQQAMTGLEDAGTFLISALEQRVVDKPDLLPAKLRPSSAKVLVTPDSYGQIADEAIMNNESILQLPEDIFFVLREKGVKRILMGGEYAYSLEEGIYAACLGNLAIILAEAGFEVRGIAGCVYPERPARNTDPQVKELLYTNSVRLAI